MGEQVREDRKLRLWLFRLIPVLLIVSLMAWCTSSNRAQRGNGAMPLAVELLELFQQNGLIDSSTSPDKLTDVAKRVGPAGMNRLLYVSASEASLPALRWMVEHGASPLDIGVIESLPLLHKVMKRPQFDRLEYFLGLKLDPKRRSADGQTLMHVAAAGGLDERVFQLLTSRGLSTSDATVTGKFPIHFANVKSIGVLAAAGADLAARDSAGRTAVHWAALEGRNDVVVELLRLGASVFVADRQGRTPLHLAAMGGSELAVDSLIAAGAPRTSRDNDGLTPRELAQSAHQGRYRQQGSERMLDKL
jgi:ankyrin repeat protein